MKKFVVLLLFAVVSIASCNDNKESILPDQPERTALGTINDKRLNEISGLAVSKKNEGIFWVHNDSGNESAIYAINSNGDIIGLIKLSKDENLDWEDITIGNGPEDNTDYIYIANTGDNLQVRKVYNIIRLKEPTIKINSKEQVIDNIYYDTIYFKYPDGSHDCEALFIDNKTKDLYIITKRDSLVNLYLIEYPQLTGLNNINTAKFVTQTKLGFNRTKKTSSWICAADLSRDGNHLIVKSYDSIYYYKIDSNLKYKLQEQPQSLHYIPEPQGESVAFSPDGKYYYTISEVGPMNIAPVIYRYNFVEPKK